MAGEKLDWEVLLLSGAGGTLRPGERMSDEDIPSQPLGTIEEVRQAIARSFPDVAWSDIPDHGHVLRDGLSFDFNVHLDNVTHSVTLRVRGTGDPMPLLVQLCKREGWIATDLTTWKVLDLEAPSREGWDRVKAAIERNRGKTFPGWPF
jgi:hypothetical protein